MDSDDSPGDKPAVFFHEAYRKQMSQQLDEAVELYKKSIECYPTAEAHTFLGWTYSFMGRLDDAIAECHKAIETDPSLWKSLQRYRRLPAAEGRKSMRPFPGFSAPWKRPATKATAFPT